MNGDWTQQAPCFGEAELMTEAHAADQVRDAVALCSGCRFTDECLDLMASAGPPSSSETNGVVAAGLTGGALAAELRRRAPREPKPIRHGTPAGARMHYRRDEKPCGPCRIAQAAKQNPDASYRVVGWAS